MRFLVLVILFLSSAANASLYIRCKLFEDNPKPRGLIEKALIKGPSFSVTPVTETMSEASLVVPVPDYGFSIQFRLTEVVRTPGVVWGGRIETQVGKNITSTSTCLYKGLGYHLFVDEKGNDLALHCQVSADLDLRLPLDQKRAKLLQGNPAEACIQGGTSSTSGSRY